MPRTACLVGLPVVLAAIGCAGAKSTTLPPEVFGHCVYENPFAHQTECEEFHGAAWTSDDAAAACAQQARSSSRARAAIATRSALASSPASTTAMSSRTSSPPKIRASPDPDDAYDADHYFMQATRVCEPPIAGEPPGHGDDAGDVCTWQAISGCTEEGRHFEDYASCDVVLTQRPYAPVPPDATLPLDDPRLRDASDRAELAWVKSELESCACVCCQRNLAR